MPMGGLLDKGPDLAQQLSTDSLFHISIHGTAETASPLITIMG